MLSSVAATTGPPVLSSNLPLVVGHPVQMPSGAMANWLDHRLHLQHGPIDLIITAEGDKAEVAAAYARAADAFCGLLDRLVNELAVLRLPAESAIISRLKGPVAKRMAAAINPYLPRHDKAGFITPMIAVAGSVADEILLAMGDKLVRASVNNGGDIALYLGKGAFFDIGIADDRDTHLSDFAMAASGGGSGHMPLHGRIRLHDHNGIGGIATSGWRGRSLSLGIADSVTVLAQNAAAADVAASLIANAITISSPAITRQPAASLVPDSDLKDRLVTVDVGPLSADEIDQALAAGAVLARQMCDCGQIMTAYARLGRRSFVIASE
jgi:uncharacterized protein